jgi:hypothetical protein
VVEAAGILVDVTEIAVPASVGEIAAVTEGAGEDKRVAVLSDRTTFCVGAGGEEGSVGFGATTRSVGPAVTLFVAQPRRSMSRRIAMRTRVTTNLNRS